MLKVGDYVKISDKGIRDLSRSRAFLDYFTARKIKIIAVGKNPLLETTYTLQHPTNIKCNFTFHHLYVTPVRARNLPEWF